MAKYILSAVAVIGFLSSPSHAKEPIKLCHVANAGFLAEVSNSAIVVDAVLQRDDYDGTFALPSETTLTSLQQGTGSFTNVKVALVTHIHGDHFDAAASLQHLRADKKVEYIVPPEALQLFKDAGLTEDNSKRIHAVLPDWEEGPKKIAANGIEIEVFRIDHGPQMPQNLGYKINLSGRTVFHTGDVNASAEQLENAGLNKNPVDLMLMPFWNILQQKETIETAWTIGTMVPMHYHAKAQPWMEQFGGPLGLRAATEVLWAGSARVDQEMQCNTFE